MEIQKNVSNKVKFYDVDSFWTLNKKPIKEEFGSWENFYGCFKRNEISVDIPSATDITVCGRWIESGCPYYKIYPGIMDKFLKTRIDIDSDLLRLPHRCFAIRIPILESPFLSWYHAGVLFYVRAIHVTGSENTISYNIHYTCDIWESNREPRASLYCDFTKTSGMSVEQLFRCLPQVRYDNIDIHLPNEILDACARLIAGVCFVATGSQKILEYDVLAEHLEAYQRLDEDSPQRKAYERAAKKRGKLGWSIGIGEGRHLKLPKGVTYADACKEAGGRELMYSHIRGGHWHKVCYGEKRLSRKVEWFEETIVRPDLPAKIAS